MIANGQCSSSFAVVAVGCSRPTLRCVRLSVSELDGASLKPVVKHELKEGLKCCTFGATSYEERHLATGDYAGNMAVWDLERLGAGPVFNVRGHASIINAIDGIGGLNVGSGAPEIVTGSRDGTNAMRELGGTECSETRQ